MAPIPRKVRIDRMDEPRLAELAEDRTPELGDIQGRAPDGEQRFFPCPLESLTVRPRYPLCEHREGSPGLLVLRKGLPLSLEDRERRGVERVAGLESPPELLLRLCVRGSDVDRRPFRRELVPAFEAPVPVRLRGRCPGLGGAKGFEEK